MKVVYQEQIDDSMDTDLDFALTNTFLTYKGR